jgi:hypothetical protein
MEEQADRIDSFSDDKIIEMTKNGAGGAWKSSARNWKNGDARIPIGVGSFSTRPRIRLVWSDPSQSRVTNFESFGLTGYFLPMKRTRSVKARPWPPEKAPKLGASILLTTVLGFWRSRMLTASTRTPQR